MEIENPNIVDIYEDINYQQEQFDEIDVELNISEINDNQEHLNDSSNENIYTQTTRELTNKEQRELVDTFEDSLMTEEECILSDKSLIDFDTTQIDFTSLNQTSEQFVVLDDSNDKTQMMRSLTFQQIGKRLKSSFWKTDLSTNDKGIASKPDFKKACQIYNYIDNHPELKIYFV